MTMIFFKIFSMSGAHICILHQVSLLFCVGRISYQKLESYTHAVFMRFQKKEDLTKFYENSFYLGVLKDHVTPYCHVRPNM